MDDDVGASDDDASACWPKVKQMREELTRFTQTVTAHLTQGGAQEKSAKADDVIIAAAGAATASQISSTSNNINSSNSASDVVRAANKDDLLFIRDALV